MRSISNIAVGLFLLTHLTVAVASPQAPAVEEKVLNIYNWSDYIAEDTIAGFQEETGIKVNYSTFDDNALLKAAMDADDGSYDLVVPSLQELSSQIQSGRMQPLDKSKLDNYGNLDPELTAFIAKLDPGNAYSVNWLWGTTGIGYDVSKINAALGPGAPVDSWDLVFKPENISKLKSCGVMIIDRPGELLPIALNYLGEDPNSADEQVIRKGQALLATIRPYITAFDSSGYFRALSAGKACLAVGWSGDLFLAAREASEAGNGVRINYVVPKEGAPIWFDMLAIPKSAKHPNNAHLFLNYVLRPEVMAAIGNYESYATANRASKPMIDKKLLEDPGVYPAPETMKRMFVFTLPSPDVERLYATLWTELKAQ
jgi:putrescine transport system substrate-binding protein